MALVLGGFIFTDYSIPEHVSLGGEHHFAVHKLIGGDRILDAMGRDDSDISWSGRFQGNDAVQKATALDQLRISGAQVPLIVDSQFYQVGIRKFEWDYERFYQVLYKITCVVASSGGGFSITGTLDGLVIGDIAAATGLVNSFAGGF
jgi:hypothetical protein